MQKQSILLFIFIIGGLIILSVFIISIIKEKPIKENNKADILTEPIIYNEDSVLGNLTAPITIIEFGDFKCSACKKVAITLEKILETYPNQVKIIWKGIPAKNKSEEALIASYCAQEQKQFLKYHNLLFANQNNLDQENFYIDLAQEINLDLRKFNSCLNSQVFLDLIQKNTIQAQELRVDATPYFFVGKKSFSGAISFEKFQIIIEEEIKKLK